MDGSKHAREIVIAHGHENVKATHPTTLEITRDEYLTPRGDCIIAIGANKALKNFSDRFKILARNPKARIIMRIRAGKLSETIIGYGHPALTFEDPRSIIVRKSSYICPRTLMIRANKAAKDLSRSLVSMLKSRDTKVIIEIEVTI